MDMSNFVTKITEMTDLTQSRLIARIYAEFPSALDWDWDWNTMIQFWRHSIIFADISWHDEERTRAYEVFGMDAETVEMYKRILAIVQSDVTAWNVGTLMMVVSRRNSNNYMCMKPAIMTEIRSSSEIRGWQKEMQGGNVLHTKVVTLVTSEELADFCIELAELDDISALSSLATKLGVTLDITLNEWF